ncbi:MAG: hypothetical protein NUW37_17360 [Planctomycetes bacterium]|nr:hypothetical protein [Planctomycetota bacterium]
MAKLVSVQKIASCTRGLITDRDNVLIDSEVIAESGIVVVVEALEEKSVYNTIELASGRNAKILKGDVIAGTLGERRALKGYVGSVPKSIMAGDKLNVLNLGGVIGKATSAHRDIGPPLSVQVLGMVVHPDGTPLNIREGAIPVADRVECDAPLIVISGTCMNAGKTRAACEIIAKLNQRRFKIAGAKTTGVAATRDLVDMLDYGAIRSLSFLDCGLPSTAEVKDILPVARGIVNELAKSKPDAIVIELGDGIIGSYGVSRIFEDRQFWGHVKAHVLCANDFVGAYGAKHFLKELNTEIDCVSGPVTDNEVGVNFIQDSLGLKAYNALNDAERLSRYIERLVFE